jgi:menaquinol-cytochrome c reductase iron-sulfur subunit
MKLFSKSESNSPVTDTGRREFLSKIGFGSLVVSVFGFTFQSIRSLIPNVLFEPSRRFKIGFPSQLSEGMTYIEEMRLYVFKEGQTYHAISGACTHLGCTVRYTKLNQPKTVEIKGEKQSISHEFHCPCHGSKFYADGTNYAGPAPRPLQWHKLEVSPDDGQLIADMTEEVDQNYRLTV